MKDQKKACSLADESLQAALDKIDDLGEDDFRDAKSIIELLKENLTLWKDEEEGGGDNIEDLWGRNWKFPLSEELIPFFSFSLRLIIIKTSGKIWFFIFTNSYFLSIQAY